MIYLFAIMLGVIPGLYLGPIIMGVGDKSQFDALAENIKKQFIEDYISNHS